MAVDRIQITRRETQVIDPIRPRGWQERIPGVVHSLVYDLLLPVQGALHSPDRHQLSDVLWAELAKWHRIQYERHPELASEFDWSGETYRLRSNPNESFAVARTARPEKPEALQGFHSEHILFLIDEASGVSDNVFVVAEGALSTEGAFVVMASNPT